MDLMAKFLLTLALIQDPGLEPKLTWHLHIYTCGSCVTQHLDVMAGAYREGDLVVILSGDEKTSHPKVQELIVQVRKKVPSAKIQVVTGDQRTGLGWYFQDDITGETISFISHGGNYNIWRSKEMLKLLR